MIASAFRLIKRVYNTDIDGAGLAWFRILYCITLLCEISQIFYFRRLIYDKVPYLDSAEIDLSVSLIVWMVAVLFLTFGLYTRYAAILNYVCSLVFIATMETYEYHMFYLYMGVNFLLIFVNVSQVNSIDRLRLKL